MGRQEMLRILLVGVILGTMGVYLWKQGHQRSPLARSSASAAKDVSPPLPSTSSQRTSPARSDYSWPTGVGEVPSSPGDPFPVTPSPPVNTSSTHQVNIPPPANHPADTTPAPTPGSPGPAKYPETAADSAKGAWPSETSDPPPMNHALEPPGLLPMPLRPEEEPDEGNAVAGLPSPEAPDPLTPEPLMPKSLSPEPTAPTSGGQANSEPLEETTTGAISRPAGSSPDAGPTLPHTGNPLRLKSDHSPEGTDQIAASERFENRLGQSSEEKKPVLSLAGMASAPTQEATPPSGEESVRFSAASESNSPEKITFPQPEGSPSAKTSAASEPAPKVPDAPLPTAPLPDMQLPAAMVAGERFPPSYEPDGNVAPPNVPELSKRPASPGKTFQPAGSLERCVGEEGLLRGKTLLAEGACPDEPWLRPEVSPLAQQAAQAHKTLFFDNPFAYVEDPCQQETFLGDRLKRLQITPWAKLDIGGEYRLRHHSERNHRGEGLTGLDDDFLLHRTRVYANLEMGELARLYAELNDALSTNETYLPRSIEENRTELQNLFLDVAVLGFRSDGLVARLGRQELLYGAGRLVSPLDWANTRRTFEGYKLFWQGPLWAVDAFWVRPIYPNPEAFDSPDQSQQLMGLYLVRRLGNQSMLEGYYLRLVEEDGSPDFDFHTLGFRSQQEYNGWLGEVEAAVQVGSYGAFDHTAGMYTIGMGRRFPCLPGQPIFWMYYDWASGDRTLGNGFHHLLPDSHQFLGYMDLFGRRNIEDWSFHLQIHPHRDWSVRIAWHIFHRQNPQDVPYGVDMTPLVNTPGGVGDYGQELDLLLQWTIRPRAELGFGYSRFFAGAFFRTNPSPAPYQDDADFFYTQLSLRF